MITVRLFAATLVLFVLSACEVVVQDWPPPRGGYHHGDFDYANRHGAIATIIAGNPFGGSKTGFDAFVRRTMHHENRGFPAEFVAGAGPRTDPLYKVVVAFNLPPGISEDRMCAAPGELSFLSLSDRVRIAMVFCEGDRRQSATQGWAVGVTSRGDARLARLIREATHTLIPYYLKDEGDDTPVIP